MVGEDVDGEPRFALLETIRTYAQEQLAASGERGPVRDRHLAWCVALAGAAEPQLTGPDQEQWLVRLEMEHDNLRAALGWAFERRDGESGVRLAGALYRFWYVRGHLTEGRRWLQEALTQPDATNVPPVLRAGALRGAGNLALEQGEYPQARAFYKESLALYRAAGDGRGTASALNSLGLGARLAGDYAGATVLHEESLALYRELGDERGIAISLGNLGTVLRALGNQAGAQQRLEESLTLFRRLGDTLSIAGLLNNLGNAALDQGNYVRAQMLYEESLALRRDLGDKYGLGLALANLGMAAYRQGDYRRAWALYAESLALQRELGDRHGLVESLEVMAQIAGAQDQPERATRLWGAVDTLRVALGLPFTLEQRTEYEQVTAALRAILGDVAYSALWIAGQSLRLEAAIAFALEPY